MSTFPSGNEALKEKLPRPDRWQRIAAVLRSWFVPRNNESAGLLAASSGIIAIAAIYLYFCGYIYSWAFYDRFGVSLESLDLPSQYYPMHSYLVLMTVPGAMVFGATAMLAYVYAHGWVKRWFLLLALILALPALAMVSLRVAREKQALERQRPTTYVQFRFKHEDAQSPLKSASMPDGVDQKVIKTNTHMDTAASPRSDDNPLEQLANKNELHLLVETKDRLVLYYQPPPIPLLPDVLPAMQVYTVLRENLAWSMVVTN
jgi:hypothetical protein